MTSTPPSPGSAELAEQRTEPGRAARDGTDRVLRAPVEPFAPHNPAQAFLKKLERLGLLTPLQTAQFLDDHPPLCQPECDAESIGGALVAVGLLSPYQLERLLGGMIHGLRLGNYKIVARLGAGAMGVVFRAEHIFMRRQAAVKMVPVHESHHASAAVDRFYAEICVLAELNHPHIVSAYEAGKELPSHAGEPELLYLAMEFLPGGDLDQYIRTHGPVPLQRACQWMAQAASGLQTAHDRGLVHRDIKPSNLLLTAQEQVKLSDFGLVKQFGTDMTDPRTLLGTVDYMAPEQSENPALVGTAADMYGLGATLFWLLTAKPPYPRSRKLSEALKQLREVAPRSARSLRPEIPAELERLVQNMLHRDPTRRPLPITAMKSLRRMEEALTTTGR
jgi:serine/threonine protein kinase